MNRPVTVPLWLPATVALFAVALMLAVARRATTTTVVLLPSPVAAVAPTVTPAPTGTEVSLPPTIAPATPTAAISGLSADTSPPFVERVPTATIDGREMFVPELHAREWGKPVATAVTRRIAMTVAGCYLLRETIEEPADEELHGAYLWQLYFCPQIIMFELESR